MGLSLKFLNRNSSFKKFIFLGPLAALGLFAGHWFSVQKNICRNPSSSEISTLGPVCAPELAQILDPQNRRESAIALLEEEFRETSTDLWSAKRLFPVLKSAMEEKNNWAGLRIYGLNPGSSIVWLQQKDLKAMNETLWNLTGTEYYLALLDLELTNLLTSFGDSTKIVNRNYKDRIMAMTLSQEQFKAKILDPLQAKLLEYVLQARYGKKEVSPEQRKFWQDWIAEKLIWTSAPSILDAYLKLKGIEPKEFKVWREKTQRLQRDLKKIVPNETKFYSLLNLFRRARGNVNEIDSIAKNEGISRELAEKFVTLEEKLQALDFLPMDNKISTWNFEALMDFFDGLSKNQDAVKRIAQRDIEKYEDSWLLQRQVFFMKFIEKGRHLVALDRRNFGGRALKARSDWLSSEAPLETLPDIYTDLTEELVGDYNELLKKVKKIFNNSPDVFLYRSGDDALISIPDATPEQLLKLKTLLDSETEKFYSHLTTRETEGEASKTAAKAMMEAREKLFDLK